MLFEMLTGSSPFAADTTSDSIAALLQREPAWARLPPETSAGIRRLLRRCLEKDAGRRLHDIADARIEIDDVAGDGLPVPETGRASIGRFPQWIPWVVAGLTLVAALAGALVGWRLSARGSAPGNVQVLRLTDLVGLEEAPAISPDGKTVAFVAANGGRRQIWVRRRRGHHLGNPGPWGTGAQNRQRAQPGRFEP